MVVLKDTLQVESADMARPPYKQFAASVRTTDPVQIVTAYGDTRYGAARALTALFRNQS